MTRTINVISVATYRHISQYSTKCFDDAMDDITANGFKAIDIKFDMDGDIIIFVSPILWGTPW